MPERVRRPVLDVSCGPGLSTAAWFRRRAGEAGTAPEIRDWCRGTLRSVFTGDDLTVIVPGYVATLARA